MKKQLLSFLAIATVGIFTWASCGQLKNSLNFDVDFNPNNIEFTIPIITTTGDVTLGDVSEKVNIDSIIKATNANMAMANIKSVTLKSCTFTMLDGDATNNFSALEAVKVSFKSDINTTPVTIIDITNNPDVEAYTLTAPINTTLNLKDYFKATQFSYTITGKARKVTTKAIKCKADLKFKINVGA